MSGTIQQNGYFLAYLASLSLSISTSRMALKRWLTVKVVSHKNDKQATHNTFKNSVDKIHFYLVRSRS